MSIVCKFGGSSLSDFDAVMQVEKIIGSNPERRYVVVSAIGSGYVGQKRVTDLLIDYINGDRAAWQEVRNRYSELSQKLGYTEMQQLLNKTESLLPCSSSEFILSRGEYLAANMMSFVLDMPMVEGSDIVAFIGDKWDLRKTCQKAKATLSRYPKAVIGGFYGSDERGNIRTFTRGGSDITGSIVANAVNADLYENWTDVDGLYAVDPSIIDDTEIIECLSYGEMACLSYFGARILHRQTVLPLKLAGIPLYIRNTFNQSANGTLVSYRKINGIKGIACKNYTLLDTESSDPLEVAKLLQTEDKAFFGINELIVLTTDENRIKQLIDTHTVTKMRIKSASAIVTVGVDCNALSAITGALSKRGIKPYVVEYKHSAVTVAVPNQDAVRTVKAIYDTVIKAKSDTKLDGT